MMESRFIIVDEHRGSDVHGVDQTKPFSHAAPMNDFLDLRRDIDEPASIRDLEPKMFSERFQLLIVAGLSRFARGFFENADGPEASRNRNRA